MNQRWVKYYPMILQLVISLLALGYVVNKMVRFTGWAVFFDQLAVKQWSFMAMLLAQLFLSVLNLSLEAFKWQLLSNVLIVQPFLDAFKQVIHGLQLGVLTPGRTGEPFGKALLFTKGYRTQALLLSAAGSMIQNLVIVLMGGLAMVMVYNSQLPADGFLSLLRQKLVHYGFMIPVLLFLMITGFYYLFRAFKANPLLKRLSFHLQVYRRLGFTLVMSLFGITFLRYLVYAFQLWLALYFFGLMDNPLRWCLVSLYLMIITFIPGIALADLGIRSSVALFLFGSGAMDTGAVVASVFIVWVFNLGLPSLSGFFLLKSKM